MSKNLGKTPSIIMNTSQTATENKNSEKQFYRDLFWLKTQLNGYTPESDYLT